MYDVCSGRAVPCNAGLWSFQTATSLRRVIRPDSDGKTEMSGRVSLIRLSTGINHVPSCTNYVYHGRRLLKLEHVLSLALSLSVFFFLFFSVILRMVTPLFYWTGAGQGRTGQDCTKHAAATSRSAPWPSSMRPSSTRTAWAEELNEVVLIRNDRMRLRQRKRKE